MQKKKIQILDTEYIDKHDLVYWTICIIDEDRTMRLAMRGNEMLDGLGIKGDVSTEQMEEFLVNIKGKTLDWETEARMKGVENCSNVGEEDMHKEIKDLESDPYFEVQRNLAEEQS